MIFFKLIFITLLFNAFSVFANICDRTQQVQDAIIQAVEKASCSKVTDQNLSSLKNLDLRYKRITDLKSNDFSGLSSLKRIELGRNKLRTLPDTVFSGLSSLEMIDLSLNELTTLPETIFSNLSSLKQIDLFGNKLKTLPKVRKGVRISTKIHPFPRD